MGPTVWELEGPIPILKSSKRLVFTLGGFLSVSLTYCRPREKIMSCRTGRLCGGRPLRGGCAGRGRIGTAGLALLGFGVCRGRLEECHQS